MIRDLGRIWEGYPFRKKNEEEDILIWTNAIPIKDVMVIGDGEEI